MQIGGWTVSRVRRRIAYLWRFEHPEPIEMWSAGTSLAFAVALLARAHRTPIVDGPYFFAAICALAGLCKVAGLICEILPLRLLGLTLGAIFWWTLAYVTFRASPASVVWLPSLVLGAAQLWALKQAIRGAGRVT